MLSFTTIARVSFVEDSGDTAMSMIGIVVRIPNHTASHLGLGLGSEVEVRISPKEG
ncbi:MAG: hypothetical protein ACYSW3_29770 [Planctomycetota bacterium]|jgi:hypothetical protein